jgi:hypothetical protein
MAWAVAAVMVAAAAELITKVVALVTEATVTAGATALALKDTLEAVAVAALVSVMLPVPMAAMRAPAAMPDPLTVMPTAKPAVLQVTVVLALVVAPVKYTGGVHNNMPGARPAVLVQVTEALEAVKAQLARLSMDCPWAITGADEVFR